MMKATEQGKPDPITIRAQTRARRVVKLLRTARLKLGLNQSRLARRAGLSQVCLVQMEQNRHYPALDTAFRLLEALRWESKRQNRAQGELRRVENVFSRPAVKAS